ncbi:Nickel uptake substrate-specific transmembrane region [Caulifigura coniformis]|uniref:Nickel uptake substrate-specific transmembrane region n=1 Tax=Caulifigura coniformis TaxID=2527983 RepID=A0A517SCG3_9PLAN|nr:DUF4198 domain-containing protein [Caulifigura coniformis]QDT53786.1 Nickel uptake substrate-specific transmembrane region [Caulifigura coniformis]
MRWVAFTVLLSVCSAAQAHDTWIQVDSPLVVAGDVAHVDLCLGNHGNEHRDFKLASKVEQGGWSLDVTSPSGRKRDLTKVLTDTGLTTREGFWTARYVADEPGLHVITHQLDKPHGTTRSVKSSKAYLYAARQGQIADSSGDVSKPLGFPIELVPLFDPILGSTAGQPLRVRVLHEAKPLANAHVSFVPRSKSLQAGFDAKYERHTDAQGEAVWTPEEGDWVLICVHHMRDDQKGEGYDKTQYTATLALPVSQVPRQVVRQTATQGK